MSSLPIILLIAVFAFMLYRGRRGYLEMWRDSPPVERGLMVVANAFLLAGMVFSRSISFWPWLLAVAGVATVARVVMWSRRTSGTRR